MQGYTDTSTGVLGSRARSHSLLWLQDLTQSQRGALQTFVPGVSGTDHIQVEKLRIMGPRPVGVRDGP